MFAILPALTFLRLILQGDFIAYICHMSVFGFLMVSSLLEADSSSPNAGLLMRRQATGLQDTLLVVLTPTIELPLVGWTSIWQSSY